MKVSEFLVAGAVGIAVMSPTTASLADEVAPVPVVYVVDQTDGRWAVAESVGDWNDAPEVDVRTAPSCAAAGILADTPALVTDIGEPPVSCVLVTNFVDEDMINGAMGTTDAYNPRTAMSYIGLNRAYEGWSKRLWQGTRKTIPERRRLWHLWLKSVTAHELGHALGIGHNNVSVMKEWSFAERAKISSPSRVLLDQAR